MAFSSLPQISDARPPYRVLKYAKPQLSTRQGIHGRGLHGRYQNFPGPSALPLYLYQKECQSPVCLEKSLYVALHWNARCRKAALWKRLAH